MSTILRGSDNFNTEYAKVPINLSTVLQGSYTLSNTIKTTVFNGFLYTGNGTSQTIVTGMESVDLTVSGNGNGIWHDRTAGDGTIKNDAGTVLPSGSMKLVKPVSKVHIKSRSVINNHFVTDGLRGINNTVYTNLTNVEYTYTSGVTAFTSTGFTVGSQFSELNTYIAYQTLYTHIKWGLTSQGKRYIEVYNPVSNEGMILYKSNGTIEDIPISMDTIDFLYGKNLNATSSWFAWKDNLTRAYLNSTDAFASGAVLNISNKISRIDVVTGGIAILGSLNNTIITYYKAKSETWTNGTYQGTGVAGNFIETKDVNGVARKPMRVVIKAISAVGDWSIFDNKRGSLSDSNTLFYNLSIAEINDNNFIYSITSDGFIINSITSANNASGGQYYYEVYFDTDADGGGAYFDNPTDTTQLQLADAIYSISNGVDIYGSKNTVSSFNGTINPVGGFIG